MLTFTNQALRKLFSRVPQTLVTENGTHYTAKSFQDWLKHIGCRQVFSPPRHPQSNGLAENFVKTLKRAIASMQPSLFPSLDRAVDNFLLQYRNDVHTTTQESLAMLFKRRPLRSSMRHLLSSEVAFLKGNNLRPVRGIVLNNIGQRLMKILDLEDGSIHQHHHDQVTYNTAPPQEDVVHG